MIYLPDPSRSLIEVKVSFVLSLQIPTSFRYRHGSEQDQRRGRGRTFRRDFSENQLSMAIEASLQSANDEYHIPSTSSNGQMAAADGSDDIDSIIQPFESLATADSESSARYLQALGHSKNGVLGDSSFPPLSGTSSNAPQISKNDLEGSSSNTMAARLRRHGKRSVSVVNSGNAWSVAGRGPVQPLSNPSQSKPSTNLGLGVSRNSGQMKTGTNSGPSPSGQTKTGTNSGPSPSTYASSIQATQRTSHRQLPAGSLRDARDNGRIVHSASAPNLIENNPVEVSISDFPPVSAAQVSKLPTSSQSLLNVENVKSANKSLVDKIRSALDFNEERYTIFKDISARYRQGTLDTGTYVDCVQQFGLSHLVLELARLCPDPQKQKELVEAYNATLQTNGFQDNNRASGSSSTHRKDSNVGKKGKGKTVDGGAERLADSFLSTVHQLQSSYEPSEEKLEVLSKGDYRTDRGKSKIKQPIDTNSGSQPKMKDGGQARTSNASLSNQNREDGGGGNKQRKKSSKFLRVRLGDGSASTLLENQHTETGPGTTDSLEENRNGTGGGLPVRGVWRTGGVHKLFS